MNQQGDFTLRDAALATLRASQGALQAAGVRHAAIFGSVARGENTPASDIDILVELDPEAPIGLVEFIDLRTHFSALLGREVDLVSRGGLRPGQRETHDQILAEAIPAF